MTGTGTATDPLVVNGIELRLAPGTTPGTNDRFLLQPTAGAAGGLGLAINDPSRIAAALPVTAAADLDNIGGGRPADLRVVDASHPALLAPAVIEFLDSGQYVSHRALFLQHVSFAKVWDRNLQSQGYLRAFRPPEHIRG